jgi:hypothetical protein
MCVVSKPQDANPFEFIVVSVLRTKQLLRGCTPRVAGSHKATVTAQMEVSAGKITGTFGGPVHAEGQTAVAPADRG